MTMSLRETISIARDLPRTDAVLMGRAEYLASEDRDLIQAVLVQGQSTARVGSLMGLSAKSVRLRVHRITRRLISRKFLNAIRALPFLPEQEAELVRLYYCRGIPQRPLARRLGVTTHALRRRLDRLSVQIDAIAQWREGFRNRPLRIRASLRDRYPEEDQ